MANKKLQKWNAHIALAYCKSCKNDLISNRGGMFVACPCGKSFIDQERFGGLYVRIGGEAELIEQLCPPNCKIKEHKKNDKNNIASDIESNIKKKR